MTKTLKYTGMLLGVIVLILVVAMIVLVTFVSPNRFKPLIAEQVKKQTGRELIIDGDLSWTFFPSLGVKAGHMSLGNPSEFTQKIFAEFASATVSVRLMPLLKGQVRSNGITLHGMTLNLIKKADGKVNWELKKENATAPVTAQTKPESQNNVAAAALGFSISAIDITDANIQWTDEQSKQTANIDDFSFHAKNINLTQAFPITTEFDFSAKPSHLSGHAELSSELSFNLDKQLYSMRELKFNALIQQNKAKINVNVTGDLIANLAQQTLQWENFKAKVENLSVTGKINVSHLTSSPQTSGHLVISPFDLKDFLKNIGQETDNLQSAKKLDGSLDFTASSSSVGASGLIKMEEVQAAKIKLTQINAKVRYQDGTLELLPLTASFYKGDLSAQTKVQLTTPAPQIQLQAKLTNVQAGPLLEDLRGPDQKLTLTGTANIDLQITTAGKEKNAIIKNLNGNTRFSFNDGVLDGADIGYLIDTAYALTSRQPMSATNSNKTNFGNLTGTMSIHDGVMNGQDLLLDSPRFNTKGQGTIDLVNQSINYSLQTSVKESQVQTVKHFSGVMIPIRITGQLNNPSIRLDTGSLLKSTAQEQIEKHKEELKQKIKDKLPGQAGELLKNLLGN